MPPDSDLLLVGMDAAAIRRELTDVEVLDSALLVATKTKLLPTENWLSKLQFCYTPSETD